MVNPCRPSSDMRREALEQLHVRAAEAIDRLVGVAHANSLPVVIAAPHSVFHEFHLHWIGVLQFVDKQEAIAFPQPVANLRMIAQQVAVSDQQILKIDDAVLPFALPIGRNHFFRHARSSRPTSTLSSTPSSL